MMLVSSSAIPKPTQLDYRQFYVVNTLETSETFNLSKVQIFEKNLFFFPKLPFLMNISRKSSCRPSSLDQHAEHLQAHKQSPFKSRDIFEL